MKKGPKGPCVNCELFLKLSNGKGMMVPYKHSLNEEKRWQLINYIRTLSVK